MTFPLKIHSIDYSITGTRLLHGPVQSYGWRACGSLVCARGLDSKPRHTIEVARLDSQDAVCAKIERRVYEII